MTLGGTARKGGLTALQVADLYWVRDSGIEPDEKTLKAAFGRLTDAIDQPALNARYVLQGGKLVKAKEKAGLVTDRAAAYALFRKAVLDPAVKTVVFPSKADQPTLTIDRLPAADKLQLIAVGKSTYYGSSAARRTNVANAASKINGAVVPSGEVFSFLNTLGGIDASNGFVGGLIISGAAPWTAWAAACARSAPPCSVRCTRRACRSWNATSTRTASGTTSRRWGSRPQCTTRAWTCA